MKLILCLSCFDIIKPPIGEPRACQCGNVEGQYLDDLHAQFTAKTDHYVLLGMHNSSMQRAIAQYRNDQANGIQHQWGLPFDAFVIPEPCDTFRRVENLAQ